VTRRPTCSPVTSLERCWPEQSWATGHTDKFGMGLGALLTFADGHLGEYGIGGVGHRAVHGGDDQVRPERVTPALGLSYEYVASRLAAPSPRLSKGRVIAAHLGAGA
jgi:acetate kinase